MIVRISGKIFEKKEQAVIVDVHGMYYEIIVPTSVLNRIDETKDALGNVHLIVYHYFQITPGGGSPFLIGFISEIERDFFLQFIKVSGIGPRAAVKAMDKPISEITRAIAQGDLDYLKSLSGIGAQRAKEIVAKLQDKVGKFGLIQDQGYVPSKNTDTPNWQQDALAILLQLQYKKSEAMDMIQKAMELTPRIKTSEELLNEIYKQKIEK